MKQMRVASLIIPMRCRFFLESRDPETSHDRLSILMISSLIVCAIIKHNLVLFSTVYLMMSSIEVNLILFFYFLSPLCCKLS